MQRAVIAGQLRQAVVEMSKQAILRQGRQGAQDAAEGDVAAGFKTGGSTVQKTECRQDAFLRPGARRAHLCRGIGDGPRGLVGGGGRRCRRSVFWCGLSRHEWTGLGQSSLLNRLAERVDFEAQMLGDVASAPTCPQQLVDITNDTILRDAEDPHDIDLAARILADQLGGEHPKRAAVILGVLEHRMSAKEVDPLAIFAHDTDQVADPGGPVGDERQ